MIFGQDKLAGVRILIAYLSSLTPDSVIDVEQNTIQSRGKGVLFEHARKKCDKVIVVCRVPYSFLNVFQKFVAHGRSDQPAT